MATLRFLGAFTFGVVLYQVVVIYIGGIVAAVQIPLSYFAFFGGANTDVVHAVLLFASFALPTAVLVAGGTLATYWMLGRRSTKAVLAAVLAGLLACFAFWAITAGPPFVPPWWAVPGFIAPWVGFALAAWLVARKVSRAG